MKKWFAGRARLAPMNAKTVFRWVAIAGSGGYGVYSLVDSFLRVFAQPDVDWAGFCLVLLPVILFYCGLFIATAYFLFRRQYRNLCTLFSALAAVVVFGFLSSLSERFGLLDYLHKLTKLTIDSPWISLITLPVSLAAFLVPFYAALWAYRRGQALLSRFVHEDTQPEKAG